MYGEARKYSVQNAGPRAGRMINVTALSWLYDVYVILAICGAVASASPPSRAEDGEITLAVIRALDRDHGVASHLIDVVTDNGIVTLRGGVDNLRALDRARRLAETVRGVRAVVNRLQVRPVARRDDQIKGDIAAVFENHAAIPESNIGVTVQNGQVTLTGVTRSWARKRLSSALVRGIRGVRSLDNQITVEESSRRSDEALEEDIRARLRMSVWTRDADIDVEVRDGGVALSGVVGSAAQKTRVTNMAWLMGARSVDAANVEVDPDQETGMPRTRIPRDLTDEQVQQAVRDAIRVAPRTDAEDILVAVRDGVVTLTGHVESFGAREAAERHAFHTVGVVDVDNYLRVRPQRQVSDSELSKRVQQALLRDPDVERMGFDVNVRNGKVTLYGEVDSNYAKERATSAAADVAGVVAVDAIGLTVLERPARDVNDDKLKRDIESELWWHPFVDSDRIQVSVESGAATLTGTVSDAHERSLATGEAYEAGARVVYNKLKIGK